MLQEVFDNSNHADLVKICEDYTYIYINPKRKPHSSYIILVLVGGLINLEP